MKKMEEHFRPVRRKDREIPREEAMKLLEAGEWGILATVSPDGHPGTVPLSYVVLDGNIYFHCAKTGEKTDNLKNQPRVSFCVVGKTLPIYEEDFATLYESVVVHGEAQPVVNEEAKRRALMALCQKYLPEHMEKAPAEIQSTMVATAIWRIQPLHVTGKARR